MFKNIIAVVDLSSVQQALIEQAVDFAMQYGARLHLAAVRAVPIHWEVSLMDPMLGIVGESDAEAERRLHRATQEAEQLGAFPHSHLLEGVVDEQIVRLAKQIGADLIVISHEDRSLVRRLFDAGAEQKLVRAAPCSVMVVRREVRRLSIRYGTAECGDQPGHGMRKPGSNHP